MAVAKKIALDDWMELNKVFSEHNLLLSYQEVMDLGQAAVAVQQLEAWHFQFQTAPSENPLTELGISPFFLHRLGRDQVLPTALLQILW